MHSSEMKFTDKRISNVSRLLLISFATNPNQFATETIGFAYQCSKLHYQPMFLQKLSCKIPSTVDISYRLSSSKGCLNVTKLVTNILLQ